MSPAGVFTSCNLAQEAIVAEGVVANERRGLIEDIVCGVTIRWQCGKLREDVIASTIGWVVHDVFSDEPMVARKQKSAI